MKKFSFIFILVLMVVIDKSVKSLPMHHDQRQEGDFNLRADLQNFVVLLIPSTKSDAFNLLDFISKAMSSTKNHRVRNNEEAINSSTEDNLLNDDDKDSSINNRSDNLYKESKIISPYQVEIGTNNNNNKNKKQHLTQNISNKAEQKIDKNLFINKKNLDTLTLLGSTMEQCGPDMRRNVNGICEMINQL